MEPIIYTLPKSDKPLELIADNIYFDTNPSPKLIKYGFNSMAEQLDLVALTSNPYYKTGLDFNFDRTDPKSFKAKGEKRLGVKNFNQTFAEFFEIINMFGIFDKNQIIFTSHPDIVQEIINISSSKSKLLGSKGNATMVLYKYSDIDIDENASIHFIIDDFSKLMDVQKEGSGMLLQLFGLQTQTMAELIYYLSTLYNEAYLVRPTVISNLSDSGYILLLGLKNKIDFRFPTYPKDNYLISIGVGLLPENLVSIIQCMNSKIIPRKYKTYYLIKSYLDSKVYEGATYQEMIQNQNEKSNIWLETFTNPEKSKKILEDILTKSDSTCVHHSELVKLLGQ